MKKNKAVKINFRLDDDMFASIKKISEMRSCSIAEVIRQAITESTRK